MIRLIMPKYPPVGTTEADAAEAARDTWDGIRPNMMSSRPGACLALLVT
jgi:hypothetical protein